MGREARGSAQRLVKRRKAAMPLAVLGCIVAGKRLCPRLVMFCLTADRGNIRRF